MVAFVNNKFINVSAHTSYLYLVKEQFKDHISRSVPHNRTAAKPSRIAAPDDSKIQNLHPVLGEPPIIHGDQNPRQYETGHLLTHCSRSAVARLTDQPDRKRIIGC